MPKRSAAQTERKRAQEIEVILFMIELYCKAHHHPDGSRFCPACQALADYVTVRTTHCPFMAEKTFCSNCRVHCYNPDMREQIRTVMRYAAPRMFRYRPMMTIYHTVSMLWEKWRLKGQ